MRLLPSPNHDSRPVPVDMLVIHYTGMATLAEAEARLCDPAAQVSAHYLIDRAGRVTRMVAEDRRAWHAGRAFWAGARDINARSIGIELENRGHEWGYQPFPDAQITALEALCRDILARHPIPPERVLGHADVAPTRKQDPGELFDWARLAAAGIGLWPDGARPGDPASVPMLLARLGYDVDADLAACIAAFQRHWRPTLVDGHADAETAGRLAALLAMTPAS